jgi:hypothetical protein
MQFAARLKVCFCLLVFPLALGARADTYQAHPAKDNTLFWQTDPNNQLSSGAGQHTFAGRTMQDSGSTGTLSLRRGLVAFDTTSIPTYATIETATLTLYHDRSPGSGNQPISLYTLTADWGEGTSDAGGIGSGGGGGAGAAATQNDATWLYRFYDASSPTSSLAWTNPGAEGDYVTVASATASVAAAMEAPHPYTWSGSGLVADVQAWVLDPSSNFGWLLKGNETAPGTVRRFESRQNINDGTGGNPEARPLLEVTYTVPEPASVSTIGVIALGLLARRRARFQSRSWSCV